MTRKWTPEMCAWLAENYTQNGIGEIRDALNAEFGTDFSYQSVYCKASKLGLRKPGRGPRTRAQRTVRWSREPEMSAWMEANDTGSIPRTIRLFAERFSFELVPAQVSAYRTAHGTAKKGDHGGAAARWNQVPVGSERDTGKGYVLVKVREKPTRPGSKDNWKMKHVLAWERYHGKKLPQGHEVLFANRDHSDYSEENLVAVPKEVVGIINGTGFEGWHDRETLEVAVAAAKLKIRITDARCAPRRCATCGREFTPLRQCPDTRTCPECVAAGHKASGRKRFTDEMGEWVRGYYPGHGLRATLAAWPFGEWRPTESTLRTYVGKMGLRRRA